MGHRDFSWRLMTRTSAWDRLSSSLASLGALISKDKGARIWFSARDAALRAQINRIGLNPRAEPRGAPMFKRQRLAQSLRPAPINDDDYSPDAEDPDGSAMYNEHGIERPEHFPDMYDSAYVSDDSD